MAYSKGSLFIPSALGFRKSSRGDVELRMNKLSFLVSSKQVAVDDIS